MVGLIVAANAVAAPQVYVDPGGLCAGFSPCFPSIGLAVENSGPETASIQVFPGVYPESVDLTMMGSAIGSGAGNLSILAVDASGQPSTSGVVIDPAAPGGPGNGAALTTGLTDPFPGDLSLTGLTLSSPDTSGAILQLAGHLGLNHLTLQGAAENGLIAFVQGPVHAADIDARLNLASGLILVAEGDIHLNRVSAERNGLIGIGAGTAGVLAASQLEGSQNDTGMVLSACTDFQLADLAASGNAGNGMEVLGDTACLSVAALDPALRVVNLANPAFSPSVDISPAIRGSVSSSMDQALAVNNGELGIRIDAADQRMELHRVQVTNNGAAGLAASAAQLVLNDVEIVANWTGAFLTAGLVFGEAIVAEGQSGSPAPFNGSGLIVESPQVVLDGIVAGANSSAGLLLVNYDASANPQMVLRNSQFTGNNWGVIQVSLARMDLTMDDIVLTDQWEAGLVLPDLARASLIGLVGSGNPLGLVANVSESLELTESSLQGGVIGISLVLADDAQARIGCSTSANHSEAGLNLLQGNRVDARSNYWGAPNGPTHPLNPGGSGDVILDSSSGGVGEVDFLPYLDNLPDSACRGLAVPAISVPATRPSGLLLLVVLLAAMALIVDKRRRYESNPVRAPS